MVIPKPTQKKEKVLWGWCWQTKKMDDPIKKQKIKIIIIFLFLFCIEVYFSTEKNGNSKTNPEKREGVMGLVLANKENGW